MSVGRPGQAKGREGSHPALERVIADLLPEEKVAAIRIYREATGASLAEAMSAVKAIADKHGKNNPVAVTIGSWSIRCLDQRTPRRFIRRLGFWLSETPDLPRQPKSCFDGEAVLAGAYWISMNYTSHPSPRSLPIARPVPTESNARSRTEGKE